MNGRDFLAVAGEVLQGNSAAHWRTVVGRCYYALFLEGREALRQWGFPLPSRDRIHRFVRLCMLYASDPNLKAVGRVLDRLSQRRNDADYDLLSPHFSNGKVAGLAFQQATTALAELDAVRNDPARLAAAIADIGSRPLP